MLVALAGSEVGYEEAEHVAKLGKSGVISNPFALRACDHLLASGLIHEKINEIRTNRIVN